MKDLLVTPLGAQVIRRLYYKTALAEYQQKQKNQDSYAYQALQQRKIAMNDLMDLLWNLPEDDKNYASYWDDQVCRGLSVPKIKDNGHLRCDYLTEKGERLALKKYRESLISMQAAFSDDVLFTIPCQYAPDEFGIKSKFDIDTFKPCTINTNYLERISGLFIALTQLHVSRRKLFTTQREVLHSIYTYDYGQNGSPYHKIGGCYKDK